jgi:hypothetical protein
VFARFSSIAKRDRARIRKRGNLLASRARLALARKVLCRGLIGSILTLTGLGRISLGLRTRSLVGGVYALEALSADR